MSSVFDQAFLLSQAICDIVIDNGINKLGSVGHASIQQYDLDPLSLLHSFGISYANKAKLIILDTPRASKRVPVNLYTSTESGEIQRRDISFDDPNYKYLHTANVLAYTRFIARALDFDGILIAITTPEVYLNIRGSIEHYLGSDKYIGELVYQSRSGGGADSTWMSTDHETMLIFSKNPQLISRFQLIKGESELTKYKLQDSESSYYWDTYIRKNARNYYPIEAPDGTYLEIDEDGNRISWLWRKQTFDEKLQKGDIKFERVSGRWRLYYKDRLKDVKILRSLSLNATLLKDIDDSLTPAGKGGDLMNAKGSDEIKAYNGEKPDYLKPSEYYKFIYSVFNKTGGLTLIPLPEFGAATESISKLPNFKDVLVVNNARMHYPLIDWRMTSSGSEVKIKNFANETYKIKSFFSEDGKLQQDLIHHLASIKFGITEEWSDFKTNEFYFSYAIQDELMTACIITLNREGHSEFASMLGSISSKYKLTGINIISEFDPEVIEGIVGSALISIDSFYHQIPNIFIK